MSWSIHPDDGYSTDVEDKEMLRKEIADLTEEYLQDGGVITYLPYGGNGYTYIPLCK